MAKRIPFSVIFATGNIIYVIISLVLSIVHYIHPIHSKYLS